MNSESAAANAGKNKIKNFLKSNFMPVIAVLLAAVSAVIVPPDKEYLGYFDLKTLSNLFVMMLVIAGLKNMRFFTFLATKFIEKLKKQRNVVLALVFITFVGSMFLANDMALLTFLPLTLDVFSISEKPRYCAFTVIMQNIAANLGGMILPFGNPQSLYLYSYFSISTAEFVSIMWIPFAFSIASIFLLCFFVVKNDELELKKEVECEIKPVNCAAYFCFFVLAVLAVLRVVDYAAVTLAVAVLMAFFDYKAYKKVDYGLLLTFCMFFVFASNMARVQAVQSAVGALVAKSALLTGVVSCQFFSNVPTAIFLSKFTNDYKSLLLATNIGGTGTIVASLASLISLGHYGRQYPQNRKKYLLLFSVINFAFLICLTLLCLVIVR